MKTTQKTDFNTIKMTVRFGYILFALMALVEVINISQIVTMALDRPAEIQQRIISLFVIMSLAMILPPVVSYFAGDRATKVKSKLEHHYNGVLFGLAAFWLWLFTTMFSFTLIPVPTIPFVPERILQFWPSFAITALMVTVAISYVMLRKQSSLTRFLPYQIVLLGSLSGVGIFNAYSIATTTFSGGHLPNGLIYNILPTLMLILMFIITLTRLSPGKPHNIMEHLTFAAIPVALAGLSMTIAGQVFSRFTTTYPDASTIESVAVGVAVWVSYLYLTTHKN